jgi:two-component system, sensor histidine kinase and response regulator
MNKIYDYSGALRRMGNDPELFQEMASLLRSDAPPLLMVVQTSFNAGDAARLHRAAHTLKGLAANFGAARAVAAAAEVERLAKTGQSAGMPAAIIEFEESLDELIAALTHAGEAPAGGAPAPEASHSAIS